MRHFVILGSLLAAIAFAGCKGKESKSPLGYVFTHHVNTKGAKPEKGDYVLFHLTVRTADSTIMQTRDQGGPAPSFQVPKTEEEKSMYQNELQKMIYDVLSVLAKGDSVTIAYGMDTIPADQKPPALADVKEIYYDLVIIDIMKEEDYRRQQEEESKKMMVIAEEKVAFAQNVREQYYAGSNAQEVKSTASGLKYIMHEEGSGSNPKTGESVSVHYIGMLKDGNIFDQSYERGQPIDFPLGVGQVIKGWDEGIGLLKPGGKATLIIPANLGYGEAGSPPVIPENAELVFYVELQ
jgi:FKBP-type peptidyl-prolyl cis-trans isomerase FkpA